MKEFATRYAILNEERAQWQQVMFVGGHTDDDAMFRLTNTLAQYKIGVTIATLTDSGARDPKRFDPDQLAETRWQEAIKAGKIGGIAQVKRLEAPDGKLLLHQKEAIGFTWDIIDQTQPIAAVTLHQEDPHTDHSTAHYVTLAVAEASLPVYSTDTINGLGIGGRKLTPDIYIPLTKEIEAIEQQNYLANASQVDIATMPDNEAQDVIDVLMMTERRGNERGLPLAAVLFEIKNLQKSNPLAETLLFSKAV